MPILIILWLIVSLVFLIGPFVALPLALALQVRIETMSVILLTSMPCVVLGYLSLHTCLIFL